MNVLIVDDQSLFRQMVKETLLSAFPAITVTEAGDGRAAMHRSAESRPDILFLDIVLPDQNGLFLTKKMKTSYPGLKVVILTSHDTEEHRQAAKEYGADRFMAKSSVSPKELEDIVREELEDIVRDARLE